MMLFPSEDGHLLIDLATQLASRCSSASRHKLADSPLFEQLKHREQLARLPSFDVFRKHAGSIFLLATVAAFQNLDTVVTGTYIISFMRLAGIPLAATAIIIFVSRFADVTGVLISGPLADLYKRKRLAYFAIGATMLVSYPFAMAIVRNHLMLVAALQCLIVLFGMGLLHGLVPILTSETFPHTISILGSGHFLRSVRHFGWNDRAGPSSKTNWSGRGPSLALSTRHLRNLRSRCNVRSALYSRDKQHQVGRSGRSGSLRCGKHGHGNRNPRQFVDSRQTRSDSVHSALSVNRVQIRQCVQMNPLPPAGSFALIRKESVGNVRFSGKRKISLR